MSDGDDPMAELRKKMAENPNFDPSSDPRLMEALENSVPAPIRELPLAVERLIVAFKDAMSGTEGVSDLDASSQLINNEQFISSPQSKWFQQGQPEETYSESVKKSLLSSLQKAHPEVKLE